MRTDRGTVRASPGSLRTRIVLENSVPDSDGAGGVEPNWTVEAHFWADIRPAGAGAPIQANGRRHRVTHQVTIRFRGDVSTGKRFRIGGRVLEIRGVRDPDERGVWLVCDCEERA